jgi:hypothetical protein
MTRQNSAMFGMVSIEDYLEFCAQAVAEFEQDQASVLRAFAAVLALNHIADWLQYKLTQEQRNTLGLGISKVDEPVKDHFEDQRDELKLVRKIANGFKHLTPSPTNQLVEGYGSGPYGVGPYGASHLLIDGGDGLPTPERWIVALSLCTRTLVWWKDQLAVVVPTNGEITHVQN